MNMDLPVTEYERLQMSLPLRVKLEIHGQEEEGNISILPASNDPVEYGFDPINAASTYTVSHNAIINAKRQNQGVYKNYNIEQDPDQYQDPDHDQSQSQQYHHSHNTRAKDQSSRRRSLRSNDPPFYTEYASVSNSKVSSYFDDDDEGSGIIAIQSYSLQCSLCSNIFQSESQLDKHLRDFHCKIVDQPFKCPICAKEYTLGRHYNIHLLKHKKDSNSSILESDNSPSIGNDFISSNSAAASTATKISAASSSSASSSRSASVSVSASASASTSKSASNSVYKCELCPNIYYNDCESLLEHTLRVHVADKQEYRQGHRKKKMSRQRNRNQNHARSRSSSSSSISSSVSMDPTKNMKFKGTPNSMSFPQQGFKCPKCSESFETEPSLRAHIAQAHVRKENQNIRHQFRCAYCSKSYRIMSQLKHHMVIHSGVRPFACDLCPKRFFRATDLTAHKLTHNLVKKYVCDLCSDKSFSSHIGLKLHRAKYHGEEKPFKCSFPSCGKSFVLQNILDDHLVTHIKNNSFACDICQKPFKSEKRVLQHQKFVHKVQRSLSVAKASVSRIGVTDVAASSYNMIDPGQASQATPSKPVKQVSEIRRGRGRPPGSKNKKKRRGQLPTDGPVKPKPSGRGRGRPRKKVLTSEEEENGDFDQDEILIQGDEDFFDIDFDSLENGS